MSLNMDDDLDMSMRAPYISMNESSELPMLIAEDLMWGAQPDLKDALNITGKSEINAETKCPETENTTKTKSMESSLAALLCNQLLQQQQQQQQMDQNKVSTSPNVQVQLLEQGGNLTIVNPSTLIIQTEENGLFRALIWS